MINFRKVLYSIWNHKHKLSLVQRRLSEVSSIQDTEAVTFQVPSKIIYSSYVESCDNSQKYSKKGKFYGRQKSQKAISKNIQSSGWMNPNIKNWMDDYEFYEGGVDEGGNINSLHGTPDITLQTSQVPCNGCGAHLHCANISLPGYIPSEIYRGRTQNELKRIICQRCHFLKHYNIALDVEVPADAYVESISRIQSEFALAVVIVDLLDFPCSIWPSMQNVLGTKRPVFIVGNKVDLLPRDSAGYLDRVKMCLKEQVLRSGFTSMNIKYISLISAKTGYGIEELITQLHKIWKHNGDVYLIGCTNVGKSSLFNILLNSDYCRPEATDLIRKATTCPWPGTTLEMLKFPILRPTQSRVYQRFKRLLAERPLCAAEEMKRKSQALTTGKSLYSQPAARIGRSFSNHKESVDAFGTSSGTQPIEVLDERKIEYRRSRWCYDTPGVMHPDQITNLLTTEELLDLAPTEMIAPRGLRLKPGLSVFLGGLARMDLIFNNCDSPDWIKILVFMPLQQPVAITKTEDASDFYREYLGTAYLGHPSGNEERLNRWPGLECKPEVLQVTGVEQGLSGDIVLSSAGWIGLSIPQGNVCRFKCWTPYGRGIHLRIPSLIPLGERLIGKKCKDSMGYNIIKPFVYKK